MKKLFKARHLLVLAGLIAILAFAVGCGRGGEPEGAAETPPPTEDAATPAPDVPVPDITGDTGRPEDHIRIEVFSQFGQLSIGNATGWFAQIVDERFNMSVNHVGAPDGNNELLLQTRSAANNLGDLIIVDINRLEDLVTAGLIMDITQYVENRMPYYNNYFGGAVARARTFHPSGNIYGIPLNVSTQSATSPALDGGFVEFAPYLRQDAFMAAGAPTINTMEDLLPVLAAMQEAVPYTDSGRRTYGFTFWSDWDDTLMSSAGNFGPMYGMRRFSQTGFVDLVNQRFESFLDDDGLYLRTLLMYFNANQMGLVDPDSPTQDFDMVWAKSEDGQFLFSWMSWLGMAGFNNEERAAQSIGYNFVPIMDQAISVPAINPNGQLHVMAIGANAADPGRLIDFLDWMSSPEGVQTIYTGPQGLTWDIDASGVPFVTEFGYEAGVHASNFQDVPVPAEWGGGTFSLGGWQNNWTVVLQHRGLEMNSATGFPYSPRFWPAAGQNVTPLQVEWSERFNAADQTEFLMNNDMLLALPAVDFAMPPDSSDMEIMRGDVRLVVQPNSWRMVFASSEAEFWSIWEETKELAYGLGWAELFAHDYAVAQEYFALRRDAMAGN